MYMLLQYVLGYSFPDVCLYGEILDRLHLFSSSCVPVGIGGTTSASVHPRCVAYKKGGGVLTYDGGYLLTGSNIRRGSHPYYHTRPSVNYDTLKPSHDNDKTEYEGKYFIGCLLFLLTASWLDTFSQPIICAARFFFLCV